MKGVGFIKGFTLIELIVALMLVAVFSAIAVPGFNRLINNNRTQAGANELGALLQYARGFAVENRTDAAVCMEGGELSVRTTCDAGGQVIRVVTAAQGVVLSSDTEAFRFNSNGSASAIANFTACHDGDVTNGFTVSVERSGQVRVYPRGQNNGGAMDACDVAPEAEEEEGP